MHRSASTTTEAEFARSLLAAAGAEAVPSGSRERVAQRLGMRVQTKAPSHAAQPAIEPPAAVQTKASAWTRLALLGVVGGLCVGGSLLLRAPRADAPLPRADAPLPSTSLTRPANAAPAVDAAEQAEPALSSADAARATLQLKDAPAATVPAPAGLEKPRKSRAPRAQHSGLTPPAANATLAANASLAAGPGLLAEVQALDRVRGALHGDQTALALTRLDDYAREFPRGELALEGAMLRVRALFASARADEARALARRTLVAPGSERYRTELERMLAAER